MEICGLFSSVGYHAQISCEEKERKWCGVLAVGLCLCGRLYIRAAMRPVMAYVDLRMVEKLVDRLAYLHTKVQCSKSLIENWIKEICTECDFQYETKRDYYGYTYISKISKEDQSRDVTIKAVEGSFEVCFSNSVDGHKVYQQFDNTIVDDEASKTFLRTKMHFSMGLSPP
jgi:hypothetical protein